MILSTPYHLLDWSSHIGRSPPERTALGNVILGTCAAQRHHWPGCTDPSDMAVRCRPPSPFRGKSTPVPRYSICVTCSTNLKRVVLRKNWAGVASGRCCLSKKGNCTGRRRSPLADPRVLAPSVGMKIDLNKNKNKYQKHERKSKSGNSLISR